MDFEARVDRALLNFFGLILFDICSCYVANHRVDFPGVSGCYCSVHICQYS